MASIDTLESLAADLDSYAADYALYERYYRGDHRLAYALNSFKAMFGRMFRPFADNFCGIVVDSATERLSVEGFRFGSSEQSDDAAWDIWKANRMPAKSIVAHTEAIKLGCAYAMVDPSGDEPRITIEHPAQCYVAVDPGDRTTRLVGIKRWTDGGYYYANLYFPDHVEKYQSAREYRVDAAPTKIEWKQIDEIDNPLNTIPLIAIENNPGILGGGVSDLRGAIPVQDAIGKLAMDLIVTSEASGMPQRVLAGVETPINPDTGEPMTQQAFIASQSKLWTIENPDAKLFQLDQASMEGFVKSIEMFVQHLSVQCRVPPHYLLSDMTNLSADALMAAEETLIGRCRRKMIDFGDSWEEVIRLCFLAKGDTERATLPAETVWASPSRQSIGPLADALGKLVAGVNLPYEAAWEMLGATPEQQKRWRETKGLPTPPSPPDSGTQVIDPNQEQNS